MSTIKNAVALTKSEGFFGTLNMIKNLVIWIYNKYILRKQFIIKKIHGSKMYLDMKDPGIARALSIVGTREKEHLYILNKELKKGSNVLDIGANIGYYVLIEKKIIGDGKIFAVEPELKNFKILERNIKINGYKGIKTFNLAMSNKRGTAKLYLSNLSNVHTLIPNDVKNQMSGRTIEVKTMAPSDFIKKIKCNINLIRMDIEGYEVEVLQDIIKIVEKGIKPSILFEVHPKKYSKSHNLKKQMLKFIKHGYCFEYMASSNNGLFEKKGYRHERAIPTDGTIRYLYSHVKDNDALKFIKKCRTVLLKPKG